MLRSTALVALLATVTATGGCAGMSSSTRGALTAGGLAIAAVGVYVAMPTAVDADHDGFNETSLDDDWSGFLPGVMIAGMGLAMLVGAVASGEEEKPSAPPAAMRVAASLAAPVPVMAYAAPAPPASIVDAERLPELPASDTTLRLAKQVRTATARGKCDAAWIMWNQLDDLDARYAEALRAGPVMTSCTH